MSLDGFRQRFLEATQAHGIPSHVAGSLIEAAVTIEEAERDDRVAALVYLSEPGSARRTFRLGPRVTVKGSISQAAAFAAGVHAMQSPSPLVLVTAFLAGVAGALEFGEEITPQDALVVWALREADAANDWTVHGTDVVVQHAREVAVEHSMEPPSREAVQWSLVRLWQIGCVEGVGDGNSLWRLSEHVVLR